MKKNILSLFLWIAALFPAYNAEVGIIDTDSEYTANISKVVDTIKILGHRASKLPANELFNPERLNNYDCIILVYRSGPLTEKEYKALADYVSEGGILLMTGLAAYWMEAPNMPKGKKGIFGEGPLKETAGVKIIGYRDNGIKQMIVQDRTHPVLKGLPEKFNMQTVPPYNYKSPSNWRRAGAYPLKASSAKTLIKVETVDRKGNLGESDFLTVKTYGLGRCYRLAINNLVTVIYEKRAKNIARIIFNLLNTTEKNE